MPAWIHERAKHILAKNKDATKQMAFGIATQQAHALGKSPKGYGTEEGREKAKEKYKTPGDDKKSANPGGLKTKKLAAVIHKEVSPLFKRLKDAHPEQAVVPDVPKNIMDGPGAFRQKDGTILLNDKPDHGVFAHELGHAELSRNWLGRAMQSTPARAADLLAGAGGVLAGSLLPTGRKGTLAASAVPLLMSAPTLGTELAASLKGHRLMKEQGATPEELSTYRKEMLSNGLTYLAGPAVGLGGVAAGRFIQSKFASAPTFLEELLKEAEANVGQWWEQVGGPFLSKGGDHGTFKSMMAEAEIPSAFQGKLLRLAEQKYPPGYNQPGSPPAQLSGLLPGLLGIGLIGGVAGLHAYRKHRQEKEEKRKAASMGFLTPEFLAAFEGELNKIGEGLPAMSSYSSSDFRRSQYSGPLGPGGFKQESLVPGMRVQSLGSAVEKPKTASMTSMLRVPESTFKPPSLKPPSVQSPATKPPVASGSKGPTIADVATPKPLTASFDNMKPGALKMTPLPGTKTEHV